MVLSQLLHPLPQRRRVHTSEKRLSVPQFFIVTHYVAISLEYAIIDLLHKFTPFSKMILEQFGTTHDATITVSYSRHGDRE